LDFGCFPSNEKGERENNENENENENIFYRNKGWD